MSPRRRARYHKLMPHVIMPEFDAWLWIDGTFQLRDSPADFLSHFPAMDVGCFDHSARKCVYAEYRSCVRLRKDDSLVMSKQIERYRREGYPADAGLTETGILFRVNCPPVAKFNETWWQELSSGSQRDQLSFDYSLWKHPELSVYRFPGTVFQNPLTIFHRHR